MNVLFNKETHQAVGLGRNPQAFEREVKNVDTTNFTKVITETVQEIEKDQQGNELLLLPIITPQETGQIRVETTEVTNEPVMLQKTKREPLIQNGEPVIYTPTSIDEATGEEIQGQPITCYTETPYEEQKVDGDGNLLYYTYIPQMSDITTYEKITSSDERWMEELEPSLVDKEVIKTVYFDSAMDKFTYQDIVELKEKQLVVGTLYTKALLFERMDLDLFTDTEANFGIDFVSIPAYKKVTTNALLLSQGHDVIGVKYESTEPLVVLVGDTLDNLQPLDQFNEIHFATPVMSVYVQFKNTSDKTVDLNSFAILG